jgi:hypothetical protein
MSFTRGIFWMMSALISVLPRRMPIKCMSYGLWKSLALDRLSPTLADYLTPIANTCQSQMGQENSSLPPFIINKLQMGMSDDHEIQSSLTNVSDWT